MPYGIVITYIHEIIKTNLHSLYDELSYYVDKNLA